MGKQSLKLFGTHAVISIFIFLFSSMIMAGAKSEFVHWLFTVMYLAMFWSITWVGYVNEGNNDLKRERFTPYKGFIIGALVQIPALLTYIVLMAEAGRNWIWIPRVLMRGWLSPYLKIASLEGFRDTDWWGILFILLYIAGVGVAYLFGKKRREKTLRVIAERESMRGELSKRDSE